MDVNNGTDAPTDIHHIIMMFFLLRGMPLFMNALFLLQHWSLAAQQHLFIAMRTFINLHHIRYKYNTIQYAVQS